MPKGKKLTDDEKALISRHIDTGISLSEIVIMANHSKTAVHNFVKDPVIYGTVKHWIKAQAPRSRFSAIFSCGFKR